MRLSAGLKLSRLSNGYPFLGPRRRLRAQPSQSFKIIVEGLNNFGRVVWPFRFNYPLTVTATERYAEEGFCSTHANSHSMMAVEDPN